MASGYELIQCSSVFEQPIEHLFKAIKILEVLEECDEIVADLRIKLMKCFEEIPMHKDGYKYYHWYRYYPTGIVQFSTQEYHTIVLDPYEADVVTSRTDDQIVMTKCMTMLRSQAPRSVYYQVREFLGTMRCDYKIPVQKVFKQIAEYNALPEETQKLLNFDADKLKDDLVNKITHDYAIYSYSEPLRLCFLSTKQIETLVVGMKLYSENSNDLYRFITSIIGYRHNSEKDHYPISIPLTYITTVERESYPGSKYKDKYNQAVNYSFDDIYAQFQAITEPNAVSVLIKAGILPKVKKVKEAVT